MLNNEEKAICEVCGKEFLKRKKKRGSGIGRRSIRGSNAKTCSKKCSAIRLRVRNIKKRTKKIKFSKKICFVYAIVVLIVYVPFVNNGSVI